MKAASIFFGAVLLLCCGITKGQSIIGKWQLVKQTSCLEEETAMNDTGVEEVMDDMKSMSGATPQVLQFKDKNMAEETTKIVSRRQAYNSKAFMYRFTGDALHFLDKRSHTILESFTVEKFDADSLIISNSSRACETKIFVRIK
ncbi:MAG TPA: hypothetical protein VIN08_10265 [Ohtaekwangia sp.]|uniref:hypothetical protein n=1 Tax=Ohtaekwangia sp. TaxID=2066019 RepID=UPI002F95BC0B